MSITVNVLVRNRKNKFKNIPGTLRHVVILFIEIIARVILRHFKTIEKRKKKRMRYIHTDWMDWSNTVFNG